MLDTFPSTWLLLDDKASHRSQILGVAQKLGWPCAEKPIRYNRLAGIANFGARLWHLEAASRRAIWPPWPELVIAAGRRSAPVALAIKNRSPRTKLVHLMWPGTAPARFDLIAVPEHDTLSYSGPNLMRTFGAPHSVTAANLSLEAARWHPKAARLPTPRLAVLIGGSGKHMQYESEDFKTLAAYASSEAERLGGSLLITSSPRTDASAEALIKSIITVSYFYHTYQSGQDNPYAAFLGLADAIIVTGDSVSMCSEACTTRKPVYIFVPPHMKKDKGGFREALFERGYAKPHTYPIRLDWHPSLMPDAADAVAKTIRKLLINETIAA
jgi:uncharacterized protein